MAASTPTPTDDPLPRDSTSTSSPLLTSDHKTNKRQERVCTVRSGTCLRIIAIVFTIVAMICFSASRNYATTVVFTALWLSLIGHLGSTIYSIFTALVYFEWKESRGRSTERNHSTSVGGLRVTIKVSRAVLVWDLLVGTTMVAGVIVCCLLGWMAGEAIAAVVFASLTAAIHFLLAIPHAKNYPISIAWASSTHEQDFIEDESPNSSRYSDLENGEEA